MLKLAGCICILAASTGMAYSGILRLRMELYQIEILMDLFTAVEGELAYCRCPLPELMGRIAEHMPAPFNAILEQSSSRMEENCEPDIPVLWADACEQYSVQLMVPKEAYEVLLRLGEVFAYSSLESSLKLLRLGQKKLELLMEGRNAEFAGRRKVYCSLCYMAGLFLIILLL